MFEALGPLLSVLFLFWSEPYVLVIEKLDLSCNLCQNCCNSDRSRRGAYGACPPLFLDQNEARRAEKNIFETGPPPYLRVWMARSPLPPYLKVWICQCSVLILLRWSRLLALETRCSSLGWDTCLSRNEMRLVHVAFFWAVYCRTAFTVSSTVKGWDSLGTENWQISVKIVLSYANVAFFTVYQNNIVIGLFVECALLLTCSEHCCV